MCPILQLFRKITWRTWLANLMIFIVAHFSLRLSNFDLSEKNKNCRKQQEIHVFFKNQFWSLNLCGRHPLGTLAWPLSKIGASIKAPKILISRSGSTGKTIQFVYRERWTNKVFMVCGAEPLLASPEVVTTTKNLEIWKFWSEKKTINFWLLNSFSATFWKENKLNISHALKFRTTHFKICFR